MIGLDLPPLDPFEHEHPLGHVGANDLGHDEIFEAAEDAGDDLRVVRLLDEVELVAQMRLELVGQRSGLEQLRALRAPL